MVLKKLLKLLSINLGEGYKAIYKQSEVHYSTERTIITRGVQDRCQSSQEWKSQQIKPKVRLSNAQRNWKKTPQKLHPNSTGLSWCVKC